MATYSFTLTREQVITKVLLKLGVIESTETPSGNDHALVADQIDLRLKELHALGVLWWQVSGASTTVALTGGSTTATISATDYLFPVSMMFVNGTDQEPIQIIGHREYQAIPDKATQGQPEQVFINGSTCYFYPTPQANGSVKLTYQAIAADSETSVTPDIPQGMLRAFIDLLAGDLVDEYGVQEPMASRLIARQAEATRIIRALNSQRVDATTVVTEYF